MSTALPATVLDFWFAAEAKPFWFATDPIFDRAVAERLLPLRETALGGGLAAWAQTPRGALALVILLDQVPRNCFRGQAAAFASDVAARDVARQAVDRRFDRQLGKDERLFLYLPFEHAEDLVAQRLSLALFADIPLDADGMAYVARHAEIIARFGRFPHRNAALGRVSTAAELAFLQEPMSSF